jgi:hypothetical protein
MNDKLKQFIDEHRETFDDEQPGDSVLKKIQEQLPGQAPLKKMIFPWRKLAAAAAILLFIVAALYFILPGKAKPAIPPVVDNPGPVIEENTDLVDPVFARQFTQYREMIGLQQSELKQLEKEYPQLYRQFVTDMNELDSSYQALKLKLPANPNRELLLEAMLQNLQLQSELLNRQLLIIKEIKQKNKQYEKNKT